MSTNEDITPINWEAVLVQNTELRAENERLRATVRLALQYMTAGGRTYIATDQDAQAAVDTLLEALRPT